MPHGPAGTGLGFETSEHIDRSGVHWRRHDSAGDGCPFHRAHNLLSTPTGVSHTATPSISTVQLLCDPFPEPPR